jgi:uroporphyrinogen-III decarboxylase
MIRAGVEGVLPLERQAGVDVNRLRRDYPEFILLGGYDKMVMKHGEAAMRAEFERILPAIKSGRYIPSVDHQTPPDVSVENYRVYVRLLKEYAAKVGD